MFPKRRNGGKGRKNRVCVRCRKQSLRHGRGQRQTKGWEVRNVKIDCGCYEVYALDEKRERVEAYFHPVTLESVKTAAE